MKKVISLLTNNFKHDNRVLKECTTLSKAGYNVTVVALHAEGLTEKETLENNKDLMCFEAFPSFVLKGFLVCFETFPCLI